MTEIALITGASSGLGREFAMQISRSEERPQEIWAVARRENRLEELQKLCGIPVRPIPLDLTRQESIRKLEELLQKEKPVIRILVNAAGFGKIGRYSEISREDTDRMIDLNCRAAVDVTLLSLPYMRRGGRILEICSTSAFSAFSLPERVRRFQIFSLPLQPCPAGGTLRRGHPGHRRLSLLDQKYGVYPQSKRHRGRRGCPPFSPLPPAGRPW